MTDTLNIRCWEPVQAHRAMQAKAWPHLKSMLMAGIKAEVIVKREKRSLKENAMLHALLGRIAAEKEWAGAKRDIETWKRLLTAAWLRARGEPLEMLPAIDGHGVDIVFRRTSELTRTECAELIEYVRAWATNEGIDV